jgi:hypothetical protein
MRILAACERSGRVRDAFIERGHTAYSCDIQPGEGRYLEYHIQGDVLEVLDKDWDIMIGFPPCTYLASAGQSEYYQPWRIQAREGAVMFVMALANAAIPKIAIENPVGRLSTYWRKPDQIIQPYWFGESYVKRTCLWLKGLPLLTASDVYQGYKRPWVDNGSKRNRDITFAGIAQAMADQWGGLHAMESLYTLVLSLDGNNNIRHASRPMVRLRHGERQSRS